MTTHVVVRNHGFTLQATFEEKDSSGLWQETLKAIIHSDTPEYDCTIWDTKRVLIEEIKPLVAET